MKSLLRRLHSKLGDFWWYTIMIFAAARAADVINVFVGLWLVPKYVPPSELGAVQPLANFASFLAIPAAVFASTFRQELSNLAVAQQFGKMKTLMRSVFIAAAVFLFLSIVVSHFILPLFLERIRIVEGSLGMLILVYSFIGTISPIFQNALQSLKKFKATTLLNLVGAPIRLLTMIAAMPLRALSGYFVGQMSIPSFSIVASLLALRKELSVKPEPYWTLPVVKRFTHLFLIFGISALACGFASLVEATVLRQRLPELDSAAYYMTTRFSEIASFVSLTLIFTIFPFTAELAAQGKDTRPIMLKAAAAIVCTNTFLAIFFCLFGRYILGILPNGAQYAEYHWTIPWLIAIGALSSLGTIYSSVEVSANRFGYMRWSIPLHAAYPLLMLAVTGHGYYSHMLGTDIVNALQAANITSLESMLWWMTAFQGIKLLCTIGDCLFREKG